MRVKITPRGKGETPRGDFHACSRFARSTIPKKKIWTKGRAIQQYRLKWKREQEKWHWEKRPLPFFEKNFHFLFVSHCYRSSRHLVSSGSLKNICKNSFLFYNFVKHSWSFGLSLICELKVVRSSIHYLDCDFYLQDFFFFAAAVFHNINAPHRGLNK